MTVPFHGFPLAPRRGRALRVLIVCRISTDHQDVRSLDDQAALCKRYVTAAYPGPVEFVVIAGRGSGEHIDREDLLKAEEAAASGDYDLIVVEDLGRICRRSRAMDFCETCEDSGTRFVAVNDAIDTVRDDWRLNAWFASFKHEASNKDTAKRIRRTLRNRFAEGGVVQTLPYGYLKPAGATSDADIKKVPEAARVYDRVFAMLEAGASYAEVADWLNADGVSVGEWVRQTAWDGRIVCRTVHNPILKGVRVRNAKVSVRVNKTGRRKAVPAPPGERLERPCPHLEFIAPDRYDRLMVKLAAGNGHYARGRAAARADGRAGVPKKRTVWPGQHARCGVCGRLFYWGGHGRAGSLMCSGARDYACWSAATFDGADGAGRIAAALLAAVETLPEFDETFRAEVEAAAAALRSDRSDRLRRLDAELATAGRAVANLTDAVAAAGFSEALRHKLAEVESRHAALAAERADLVRRPDETPPLPPVEELKAEARRLLTGADFADPAFGRTLTALVPAVELFPVQLLDGGRVELRAKLTLHLTHLAGPGRHAPADLLTRTVWVDLFDPPQRAACRERVSILRTSGRTEREAAAELGLTVAAAQAAMALHRRMAVDGRADPYVVLTAPPADGRVNARHLHDRYRFDPLPGYPADPGG